MNNIATNIKKYQDEIGDKISLVAVSKKRSNDDILKAYDAKDLEKFYFEYHLQKHHRIVMQGEINPQQSHVSRYYVRPFDSVEYNSDYLWLFKNSVVAGLGFKVDKYDLDAAIKEFDRILADPEISKTILAAVDAINKIEEKGQAA